MGQLKRLLVAFIALALYGCGDRNATEWQDMLDESLECPDGSHSQIKRWGGIDEDAWSHSCTMNHGKYHVWRSGVLVIEGQFNYGKRSGEWIIRDKNGDVTKVVIYENGKVISEQEE